MKKYLMFLLVLFSFVLASCNNKSTIDGGAGSRQQSKQYSYEGKNVYFAAPLFSEAEREYNLKIVHILEKYDYKDFLPQRDGYLAPELKGKTEQEVKTMIFNKDYEEVKKADIVFVLLDGRAPDEGACVELGIAYESGKRCYGFKSDARSVELNMDLNPMISECFIHLFYNLDGDALINDLEDYLSKNKL